MFFIYSDLNHALEVTEEPADLLLQRAVPQVESHLKDMKNQIASLSTQVQTLTQLTQGFQSIPTTLFQQLQPFLRVNNQAHTMMEQWNKIVTQGATLNVRFDSQPLSSNEPQEQVNHSIENSSQDTSLTVPNDEENSSTLSDQQMSVSFSPFPIVETSAQLETSSSVTIDTNINASLELTVQAFKNVETIPALWRIWFDGLPGHYPVCELDRVYGLKHWRGSSGDSKFYQRRQKVIKRIESFMNCHNYNRNEALQLLEEKRINNPNGSLSIHYISEHIDEFFA